MSSISVPLAHAVMVDGVETKSIDLKRVKAKHLRRLESLSGVDQLLALIQRSSGWAPEHVDEIDAEDLEAIGERLDSMMGKSKGG